LIVSLIRSVAAESRQMTPYLGAVASFGIENFAEITQYLDRRTADELQRVIDAKLREYLNVVGNPGSPDSWNVDAALRRFADMANADTDLRKRATAIGAQKFLRGQLAELREALTTIDSRASDLEQQAREWLGQRAQAPDGHERHWGSFGDPAIGLHMSPRMQRWNPDRLDTPLRWVVLKLEHEFERDEQVIPVATDPGTVSSQAKTSLTLKERLNRLAALLADGTITQAEHDASRRRILEQL
ncbi:MAG: hypothetical protein KGI36_07835, partial [Burkholderiales bacterium]|nr:hypothetical protein [Burkholderiales bacterium]